MPEHFTIVVESRTHRPRVVVAHSDARTRVAHAEALRAAGFVISAQAADGVDATDLAVHYGPDLLVLGPDLPRRDAIETTRRVVAARDAVRIVVLLEPGGRRDAVLDAMAAGAHGIVAADASHDAVCSALLAVHLGHGTVPAELMQERLPVPGRGYRPIHGPLSNREWQIADLLIAGHSVAEVTDELFLTQATMRSHLKHMYAKLDVHSRAELIDAARRLFYGEWTAVSPPPT